MKRALLAAAALTLAAASGCGWQMQNMQGNHCVDNGACGAACGTGQGRLRDRIGNGQLRDRLAAGVHCGPPHIQGDFLSGLAAHRHQQNAPATDGPVPRAHHRTGTRVDLTIPVVRAPDAKRPPGSGGRSVGL